MKAFLGDNFLLCNKTAEKLYNAYAKDMPIYDYHCHLSVKEIAEDKKYRNITEVWLGGDHYKWRALRNDGVPEEYITGDASDKEKFLKWADTISRCIGNPLYHWTHLELKRFFNIDKLLSLETAEEIWDECNELLQKDSFSARELIRRSKVKLICTTDDPSDDLRYHEALGKDASFNVKVLPTFRPEKGIHIENDGFREWIAALGSAAGHSITTFPELADALMKRIEYFHEKGCRISDQSMERLEYTESTEEEASIALGKSLKGVKLTDIEIKKYKTQVMIFLGRQYARLGWVMQLHLGPVRNINSKMMKKVGLDAGFDTIGDSVQFNTLSRFLDTLDVKDELPKTILYCLNPRDNEVMGTIIGCFQESGNPGKMQFGSGWWYNDQKDGMNKQMVALANMGLLNRFIGMTTDSRSFLSYIRHEYFRRVLCNLLGEWVENGEAPDDMKLIGNMVQDICYNNAKTYFNINF